MVVISGFLIFQPRLPFTLGIAGGLLGALTGMMQHLSMVHDPAWVRRGVISHGRPDVP